VKTIDKLPRHKQMAVMYEAVGFSRTKISDALEVSPTTITGWRSEPEYQAALQETMTEIHEDVLEKYKTSLDVVIEGHFHEAVKRAISDDEMSIVPLEKIVKNIQILINLHPQVNPVVGDVPEKPGDKKSDPLSELKKRYAGSQTAQELNGEKVEEDEEGD